MSVLYMCVKLACLSLMSIGADYVDCQCSLALALAISHVMSGARQSPPDHVTSVMFLLCPLQRSYLTILLGLRRILCVTMQHM